MIGAAAIAVLLIASVEFNIYQYVEQKNERKARLENTLLRPSQVPAALSHEP